ncbi:MAG: sigma-54-dependent Fis family transcriptional regulator [Deltaproteobacteria bacterium]|nr:MAG: sigma-54-dependent Fis family transcriptional regulator [Deltaproteobacteria bacterium]
MSERILVVDDEAVLRHNVVRFLSSLGHDAVAAGSGERAVDLLGAEPFDLVITDLRMPGMGGIDLLSHLAQRYPDTLAIVITAHASIETAVDALRLGAQDYLLKPISLDELGRKVGHLLEHRNLQRQVRRLRQELHQRYDTTGMIADSAAMQPVLRLIAKAAGSRSTVLIEGESGTGKELVARALHDRSPWADKDFIAVNLAAQPAELVDATLFGHERGAFTGATSRREGIFRAARGGTVFLDEIGELPMPVQVKLLRVLENREVQPVGSDRPVPVDFRLVCATNRSLRQLAEAGEFRDDLRFRLDVLRIELPPLRDRREDIAPLAWYFLRQHARAMGLPAPSLSTEALRLLERWHWPGNVRELSNIIERAVLLCDDDRIDPADLPAELREVPASSTTNLKEAVTAFERTHIQRVLDRCQGNKPQAAELLGIHLATLYRHLERLGVG